MRENLLKIINNYGVKHQLKKLSEEVYELQEAVNLYEMFMEIYGENLEQLDNKEEAFLKHIEEEFADVMVLLEQFKTFYGLDNSKIMEIMEQKINRQLQRIEKENAR